MTFGHGSATRVMPPVPLLRQGSRSRTSTNEELHDVKPELTIVTVNMRGSTKAGLDYSGQSRRDLLRGLLQPDGGPPADVLCLQEALHRDNELTSLGYRQVFSSHGTRAPTVGMGSYLNATGAALSGSDKGEGAYAAAAGSKLVSAIYIHSSSAWVATEAGAKSISSDTELNGEDGRAAGPLAARCIVWARLQFSLRRLSDKQQAQRLYESGLVDCGQVVLACTQLSGNQNEDTYFLSSLSEERTHQMRTALASLKLDDGALGILVGSFHDAPQACVARCVCQCFLHSPLALPTALHHSHCLRPFTMTPCPYATRTDGRVLQITDSIFTWCAGRCAGKGRVSIGPERTVCGLHLIAGG